jgi:hypothetical protein
MIYGELIGGFNSVQNVARAVLNADFNDISVYENLEMAADVTYDDAMEALCSLDTENSSLSVIEPLDR